jgi:hypothetical protein
MKKLIAAVALVAALAVPGVASAATPTAIWDAVWSQAGGVAQNNDVRCVSGSVLGGTSGRWTTVGSYDGWTIFLHRRYVCQPIVAYARSGELDEFTLDALSTLYHEVAHARGVVNERQAECKGSKMALKELWLRGEPGSILRWARDYLLHDADDYRPPAYDLNGTCG